MVDSSRENCCGRETAGGAADAAKGRAEMQTGAGGYPGPRSFNYYFFLAAFFLAAFFLAFFLAAIIVSLKVN